jgi:hypothetical protein
MKKSTLVLFLLFTVGFYSCILPTDTDTTALLDRLKESKYISVDFNADIKTNSALSFTVLLIDNIPYEGLEDNPIQWNDNTFSVNFDYSYELFSGDKVRAYGNITGKLTQDSQTIESLTADQTTLYLDTDEVFKDFITIIDVPYQADYEYDSYSPRFSVEGESVKNHVYSFSQSWEYTNDEGQRQLIYSTNLFYDNPDDVPYLHVTFSE